MFRDDAARIDSVERAGVPSSSVLIGLLGALATGYLLTVNIAMAFGFLVFLALFFVTVQHPAALVPGLVMLTVVIERALQSVGITVGGRELLNFCGVVNLCLAAAIRLLRDHRENAAVRIPADAVLRSVPGGGVLLHCWFRVDALMTVRSIVRITAGYCIYLMITQFITEKRQIDRLVQILIAGQPHSDRRRFL